MISKEVRIALIGEAPGATEEKTRRPFQGESGKLLSQMLSDAGIVPRDCMIASFSKDNLDDLRLLSHQLAEVKPNIAIALGNTALWALTSHTAISKYRGTIIWSDGSAPVRFKGKVLPTFHPTSILRNWKFLPIAVADLIKAKENSSTPEFDKPERMILIPQMPEEVETFFANIPDGAEVAIDIETYRNNLISCIGFSKTPSIAMVVPFCSKTTASGRYWTHLRVERRVWEILRTNLESRRFVKVFQNGLYDLRYLFAEASIRVQGPFVDTMVLHHALYPELPKSLGFLGSIYTNETAWKQERNGNR